MNFPTASARRRASSLPDTDDGESDSLSAASTEATASVAPGKPQRRIALLGSFGIGNMGNDASMETMLRFLREQAPGCSIHCLSVDPDAIGQTYGVDTVRLNHRFRSYLLFRLDKVLFRIPGGFIDAAKTLRAARKFDLLIAPGTGLLDDFRTGPFNWPYTLLKWCLAARLCGAQIWLVSIGAGPIKNPLSRWMMKTAARLAQYRSYRDRISLEFMKNIGFDTGTDWVYPDIVFKMEAPDAAIASSQDEELTIGIGIMGYQGWHAWNAGGEDIYASYLSRITVFIAWLLDNDYNVRLFTGARSDRGTLEAIAERLAALRPELCQRCVAVETNSLSELMEQMARVQIVAATRFHNIVCSLKLGKPTISLGYAKKNDVLMAEFGLGEYCHHIEDFDVERLKSQMVEICRERRELSVSIQHRADAFRAELAHQDRHLLSELLR